MKALFWLSVSFVIYTYAGYPVLIALLARFFPRLWKQQKWSLERDRPRVSVIMAVHNGASLMKAKLEHLVELNPLVVQEIIVVSDGSTDATVTICQDFPDQRVRVIELPQHSGKAAALSSGIGAARGDVLMFIDLRARLAPGALDLLLENFADERIGCAGGELHLLEASDHTIRAVGGFYWKYERWLRSRESLFDSSVGLSGCFFAARREAVTVPPAGLILDDVFQPLSIIRKGYRSIVDPRAIVTDTLPQTTAGEFARKVRTLAGNYQLLSEAPWTMSPSNRTLWQFVSHKLCRLVVPYALVIVLLSSVWLGFSSHLFAGVAAIQLTIWLTVCLNIKTGIEIFDQALSAGRALLLLNAAAVAGLYVYLTTRGSLWKIWSPGSASKPISEKL